VLEAPETPSRKLDPKRLKVEKQKCFEGNPPPKRKNL
jgi:hypothetical protein